MSLIFWTKASQITEGVTLFFYGLLALLILGSCGFCAWGIFTD